MTKYSMFAELAQVERETLSRRVKAGLEAARRRGRKPGRRPKDHTYIVASISRMRREGMTFEKIAEHLKMNRRYVSRLYNAHKK